MKILIDPIYSAKPSHCASARKMWLFVDYTLQKRQDVFFRWLVPQNLPQEERDWFPQHPNVELIEYPYNKDRMREYQVFTAEMEDLLAFNGSFWDTDAVVTMRTQQVPNMKIVMCSPRQRNMPWTKKVVLYEEMPVMSFKPTVAVGDAEVQDKATLLGYCAADNVLITIQHEKDGIIQAARSFLAPSQVLKLREKIQVASPARIEQFEEKKPEFRFKRGTRPFCLGYTGRMIPSISNLQTLYGLADKNWILKGDKGFRMVFSTVSVSCKLPPPDFCEVKHLPREEFWKLIRTELDLVIYIDQESGFGMSFFEPMMMGTPMLAPWKPWARALLGDDYPFYVGGLKECYGVVKAFHDHYEDMYAKFYEWQQTKFKAQFQEGGQYAKNYTEELYSTVATWQGEMLARYRAQFPGRVDNEIVREVVKKVEGRDEFVLFDVLGELGHEGTIRSLTRKLGEDRLDRGIVWSTAWNDFRLALQAHHGWVDASGKVGHLRRP